MMRAKELEKIIKGFANHRRIDILWLIDLRPNLSTWEISDELKVNFKTISEHTRRLTIAGLVIKRYEGQTVRHCLSALGKSALRFTLSLK